MLQPSLILFELEYSDPRKPSYAIRTLVIIQHYWFFGYYVAVMTALKNEIEKGGKGEEKAHKEDLVEYIGIVTSKPKTQPGD